MANPIKDAQEAYIYNTKGGSNPMYLFKAIFKGYGRVIKAMANHVGLSKRGGLESEKEWKEYMAMGGSQATMVSEDIDTAEDILNNMTKSNWEQWKSKPFSRTLRSLQSFSEELENSTRLEVYKRTKAELAAKRPNGKATVADMKRAAYEARNATIDFARAGSKVRTWNRYIAFLNATLQSWDKSARLFLSPKKWSTEEGRKEIFNTAFRMAVMTIPLALAQALSNYDDDKYKYQVQKMMKYICSSKLAEKHKLDIGLQRNTRRLYQNSKKL